MTESNGDDGSATRTASSSVGLVYDDGPAPAGLEPGMCVDRYLVIEFLGEGGMSKVYRARDTELDREIALKWIDPRRFGAPRARFLLRREAQAMARVEHPSVVRIYDVGAASGHLFVAMELVRGGPLGTWIRAKPRSWRDVLRVFAEAGRGIAAAHRAGLVHRDIKPSNILLDDVGRPRISDFGVARMLDDEVDDAPTSAAPDDSNVTRTGAMVGTPAYMAPEQLTGKPVDTRADQFAFCVALWEALLGTRPFPLDDVAPQSLRALLVAIRAGEIERPPGPPRAPRRVLAVLRRGLAGDRAARWPSMDALLAALDQAARPRRRRRVALVAAAVAAATLVWAVARRAGVVEPLELGTARLIARSDGERVAVTMLRDGRFVRLDDGALSVITNDGLARRGLDIPPGVVLGSLHASTVDGWLDIQTRGATCAWWHAQVDGGAWQLLLDDPSCSRSVAVRPDGAVLAISDGDALRIRDRASGAERVLVGNTQIYGRTAWSPDGARLAVLVHDGLVVLDAATGARIAAPHGGTQGQWVDRDRILYLTGGTWTRGELRLLDLRSGVDRRVREVDGAIRSLAVGRDGVLIHREVNEGQAYVAAVPPPHPLAVDELTLLDTGAEIDFLPVMWTDDRAVITVGVTVGRRGLVRTVPGQHGAPLVSHRADRIMLDGTSEDHILYLVDEGERCTTRAYDLATGHDQPIDERSCADRLFARCAVDEPRCIATSTAGSRWFDTASLTFGGAAPALGLDDRLSPDAREIMQLRGNRITVRTIATGAETAIALSPPVLGLTSIKWGNDAGTLIVQAYEPGHDRVLLAARDGRWRALLDEPHRGINGAVLSPDGRQLAVVAQRREVMWSYLPFVPPGAP